MDCPKLLGEVEALQIRLSKINEPHIAPLSRFVERLRKKMGPEAEIPYFDPWDGGINAEVLFLLEAPGPKAKNSGFVSMNNPDETAKNIFEAINDAGISRKYIVLWNTVPWYIGSGIKIRPANSVDIATGIESLAELLKLLPKLKAIVLVGGKAQKVEGHIKSVSPNLKIFKSPHPSPLFVNRKPENKSILMNSFRSIQSILKS